MKNSAGTKQTYRANNKVWNQSRITVVGNNNVLNGNHCVARGQSNVINGDACMVEGNHCVVNGDECIVNGAHCVVNGDDCIVNGGNCSVNGDNCVVTGEDCDFFGDSETEGSDAGDSAKRARVSAASTTTITGGIVAGMDAASRPNAAWRIANQPAEPPARRIRRTVQTGGATFNFFGGGGTVATLDDVRVPGEWSTREMAEAFGLSVARPSPSPASSSPPPDPYANIKDLAPEPAPEGSGRECKICEENVANVAYQCGHVHCPACARKMTECPQCRVRVQTCIRLFHS